MTVPALLEASLKPDSSLRRIARDIWSAVETPPSLIYDRHAALYDKLIGNRRYNRIAWGSSPQSYARFARQATMTGTGPLLDGGCGSLVSTVEIHIASRRPTILCDLSEGMLGAARDRIIDIAGAIPDHLTLLQADLTALPFNDGCFGTVLCPGMLHIFEDVEGVTGELARVTAADGHLFLSSLVAERWISSRYLALLHRAEEVAHPRHRKQLVDRLSSPQSGLKVPLDTELEGSVLFITARPRTGDDGARFQNPG
jgi:SAM-dependent methyltransferase